MPRPKAPTLNDYRPYQEYTEGVDGKRWPNDTQFDRNEAGAVIVPQGEVFCRMPKLAGGKGLCESDYVMLPQNLKVHIKGAHKSAVEGTRRGGSSALDLVAIKAFYDNRLATLKGEADPNAPVLAVPSKLARVSESEEPKEVTYTVEELGVPTYSRNGVNWSKGDPWGKKMKEECGLKYKPNELCSSCEENGVAKCPPPEPTDRCEIWSWYIERHLERLDAAEDEEDDEDEEGEQAEEE